MKKNIFKILIFSFLFFVLAASFVWAYNQKVSACSNLNDICTAITDDLPDRATGIDPNQEVNLGLGVFDQTTRIAQVLPVTGSTPPATASQNKTTSLNFPNPLAAEDFTELIQAIQQWLIYLAIPIAAIMIVISGVIMLASGGDPGRFSQAKKMLLWAVIGLAVVLIGEGFFKLIESIINLKNR